MIVNAKMVHVHADAAARMTPKSPFHGGKMLLFVLLLFVDILPVGGDRHRRLKGGVSSRSNTNSALASEQEQQQEHENDTSRSRALFFWLRGRDRERMVVSVYGFNLINTLTNQVVGGRPLVNNQVVVLDDIPGMSTTKTPSFNLEAILTRYTLNDLEKISVLFRQSSVEPHVVHKEIQMPFALCGNHGSRNYTTCPSLGLLSTHTIKATPYTSKRNLSPSNKGQGLSITFTIVQSNMTSSSTP